VTDVSKALAGGSLKGRSTVLGCPRALPSCYCCEESVSPACPDQDEFSSYQLTLLAGAGKTYIASKVIDAFLLDPTPQKLAYFYCNRAEENRRKPESILNTLIQQLAQTGLKNDELLKPVVENYEDRENKGQESSPLVLSESEKLLIKLTDLYPQTTICIDALDEVEKESRISLLKSLKNVIEGSKNLVKIFATTRMDPDILTQFEMFPRIELQPDDNVDDINRFVGKKVQSAIEDRLLLQGDVSHELKTKICDVLCERSKGM
jgi:hypothetical protein